MKLFVLFFFGITLSLIGSNEGAASYEVKQVIKNVTTRLEKIQKTSDQMFTLEDWINPKKLDKVKEVAEEDHIPDAMVTVLKSVIEKLDATMAEKEDIEKKSKEIHDVHRNEREEEETIFKTISDTVNNGNLEEKSLKTVQKLLEYLNQVHTGFKNYDQVKKQFEKKFVDKIYSNTFFTNKLVRAGNSASSLASFAAKNPKLQTDNKIKAASETAEKKILQPLIAGLEHKNKALLLSKLRDNNEENYRKFYDNQKKILGKIETLLNGDASGSEK